MNCQSCQEKFDAYRRGKLSPDMKTQVETHLETCKQCSEAYFIQELAERVISTEKEILPNPFLHARIMAGIDNYEPARRNAIAGYIHALRPAIIATSLAAAIFIGIMIGNIYKPADNLMVIPVEFALIDDARIELVHVLSNGQNDESRQ
jgi:anti-sigma factor RsiW